MEEAGTTTRKVAVKDDPVMKIQTTRFGELDIDGSRTLLFEKGLLGFAEHKEYVLLEAGDEGETPTFWWLQSVDKPDLAFVVTDPSLFVSTYRVPIHAQQMAALEIDSIDDAQVLVIVNKRGQVLTGNLQGPLVINMHTRRAEQLVLSDRRFTTRVPLVELPAEQPAAMAG